MSLRIGLIFIVLSIAHLSVEQFYFGLMSRKVLDDYFDFDNSSTEQVICQSLNLNKFQSRICRRDKKLALLLAKAVNLSIVECEFQFKDERWNCPRGQMRVNTVIKGFKEASFLFAITSASLIQKIVEGCSEGKIYQEYAMEDISNCIRYAEKFVRKFLSVSSVVDARTSVDIHNLNVGIMARISHIIEEPKLGPSGKVVKKLGYFRDVGTKLKKYYHDAAQYSSINTGKKNKRKPKKNKKFQRDGLPMDVKLKSDFGDVENLLQSDNANQSSQSEKPKKNFEEKQKSKKNRRRLRKTLKDKVGNFEVGNLLQSSNATQISRLKRRKSHDKKQKSKKSSKHLKGKDKKLKRLPRKLLLKETESLVFMEESPKFCKRSDYSPGVVNRRCNVRETCFHLCCHSCEPDCGRLDLNNVTSYTCVRKRKGKKKNRKSKLSV